MHVDLWCRSAFFRIKSQFVWLGSHFDALEVPPSFIHSGQPKLQAHLKRSQRAPPSPMAKNYKELTCRDPISSAFFKLSHVAKFSTSALSLSLVLSVSVSVSVAVSVSVSLSLSLFQFATSSGQVCLELTSSKLGPYTLSRACSASPTPAPWPWRMRGNACQCLFHRCPNASREA